MKIQKVVLLNEGDYNNFIYGKYYPSLNSYVESGWCVIFHKEDGQSAVFLLEKDE